MKNKLLIFAAAIGVWWLAQRGGVRLLAVASGSMEPAIPAGSLIVVLAKGSYSAGDIISFNKADEKSVITHRIIRIEEDNGRIGYFTKGDQNEEEDKDPVYSNEVAGKVAVVIPKLGGAFLRVKKIISLAFFADQEMSTGNGLAAGTLDLKISDGDEAAGDSLTMTWNGGNLRPGSGSVGADLKIKNSGTVASNHIHIQAVNAITQGSGPGADAADPMDANLEILTLYYNEVSIKSYLTDKNGNGIIDLDDWEKTPTQEFSLALTDLDNDHTLSLTVGLRSGTSAADQGDTVEMNFLVTGHQLADPVLVGFNDSDGTTGRFAAARDWTAPTSSVTGLSNYQQNLPFGVNYTAADAETGVNSVTLYYRKGTTGGFTMFKTQTHSGQANVSGSFSFDVSGLGDGRYEFATLAADVDANAESAPIAAEGFTILDTAAPATTLTTTTGIVVDEKVINGNFNSGLATGWSYAGEVVRISGSETAGGVTVAPPSGSGGMARIGHTEADAGDLEKGNSVWDNRLTQIIDKQDGFLSFWWRGLSFDAGENPAAVVTVNDSEVLRLTGAEIDGGGYPNDTGWRRVFVDLTGFSDDKLELKFYAGNSDSLAAEQSWMYIDEVTTGRPAIRSGAGVVLTGADTNGVAKIHYSLDDGATWTTAAGSSVTIAGINLAAGVNLVKYYSTDNAGNDEAIPAVATQVIVDDQSPNIPEDFIVSGISEHEINVSWTAPADLGYFSRAAFYRLTVNGTAVPNVKAPAAAGNAETFMAAGLLAGTQYSVELSACDPVNNCSPAATATTTTLTEHDADPGDVVINELMWMGMNGNSGDEWLELRNMTDKSINISGWQLTKKRTTDGVEVAMFTFPTGTAISAGGYLWLSEFDRDHSALNVNPTLTAGSGSDDNTDFSLANTDLQIKFYDGDFSAGGLLIDNADDGTGTPAAGLTELAGEAVYYSMERNATPGDGTQAGNWHTTLADTASFFDAGLTAVRGTPGAENRSQGQITDNREQKTENRIPTTTDLKLDLSIDENPEASPSGEAVEKIASGSAEIIK